MSILAKERLLAVPHVTDEQVIELRQLFLKKLETDGAPCEGKYKNLSINLNCMSISI